MLTPVLSVTQVEQPRPLSRRSKVRVIVTAKRGTPGISSTQVTGTGAGAGVGVAVIGSGMNPATDFGARNKAWGNLSTSQSKPANILGFSPQP